MHMSLGYVECVPNHDCMRAYLLVCAVATENFRLTTLYSSLTLPICKKHTASQHNAVGESTTSPLGFVTLTDSVPRSKNLFLRRLAFSEVEHVYRVSVAQYVPWGMISFCPSFHSSWFMRRYVALDLGSPSLSHNKSMSSTRASLTSGWMKRCWFRTSCRLNPMVQGFLPARGHAVVTRGSCTMPHVGVQLLDGAGVGQDWSWSKVLNKTCRRK